MANYTMTNITFYSDNLTQLEKLFETIKQIMESPSTDDNGFGNGWLGDFVNTLLSPTLSHEDVRCRGFIRDIYDISEGAFEIECEEAYSPCINMWKLILEKHFSEVKMVYTSEEPGDGLYVNSDEEGLFYPERYLVEMGREEEVADFRECFHTIEDVNKAVEEQKILNNYPWINIIEFKFSCDDEEETNI